MTFPKDDSDGSPISEQEVFQDLLPRNSRKNPTALPVTRNYSDSDTSISNPNRKVLPWYAFTISVAIFIVNKVFQSLFDFTTDINNIIDIFVFISVVAALTAYYLYNFGGKNG